MVHIVLRKKSRVGTVKAFAHKADDSLRHEDQYSVLWEDWSPLAAAVGLTASQVLGDILRGQLNTA